MSEIQEDCCNCYGTGIIWVEGLNNDPIEEECSSCYGTGIQIEEPVTYEEDTSSAF